MDLEIFQQKSSLENAQTVPLHANTWISELKILLFLILLLHVHDFMPFSTFIENEVYYFAVVGLSVNNLSNTITAQQVYACMLYKNFSCY